MKTIAMHDATIRLTIPGNPGFPPEYVGHQVLARAGYASIRDRNAELIVEKQNATATRRDAETGGWVVEFADGETWSLFQPPKKCGACP